MSYAIISLGGKQYRVREGERLLVDRVAQDEGASFSPPVLFSGGDDAGGRVAPDDVTVTVRVVGHVLGEKIRIGKYKPKSGYRRHTGHRSRLSRIEVESIGAERGPERAAKPTAEAAADRPPAEAKPEEAPKGMPSGYAELTVAQISEGAKSWNRPMLEAALEYERAHAKRKGAFSALESALAKKGES